LKCSQIVNGSVLLLPERQVLLEQLNDGLRIPEGVLINIVKLVEGILECLLAEFAGLLDVAHDLVVEY
jgi:hypothetical protein